MSNLDLLRSKRRSFNIIAALFCAALVVYALYTQKYLGLDPCPLCMFQRVAVIALGIAFALAALVPQRNHGLGLVAMCLVGLAALAGGGIAVRHLYIQSLPPGQVPVCGATLDYMFDVFPITEVLRKVLTGSGECAKVDWTFMGLSMPGWVLIWAAVLGTIGVLVNWRPRARLAQ
jgi:disulfide bond formation protein DsbB